MVGLASCFLDWFDVVEFDDWNFVFGVLFINIFFSINDLFDDFDDGSLIQIDFGNQFIIVYQDCIEVRLVFELDLLFIIFIFIVEKE